MWNSVFEQPAIKLLITASTADDAVFWIIAISTARSWGEPTVLACFTTGSNGGASFHLETGSETSYLHRFLCASRIGWLAGGAKMIHRRFGVWCRGEDWLCVHRRIIKLWTQGDKYHHWFLITGVKVPAVIQLFVAVIVWYVDFRFFYLNIKMCSFLAHSRKICACHYVYIGQKYIFQCVYSQIIDGSTIYKKTRIHR